MTLKSLATVRGFLLMAICFVCQSGPSSFGGIQ
nr:MAG TPA: hypothetical protein [Caudoviricetes sp.]